MKNGFLITLFTLITSILVLTGAKSKKAHEALLQDLDSLNKAALVLGNSVRGKLDDMQVEAFNKRMIKDQKVIAKALEDVARQLNITLERNPPNIDIDKKNGTKMSQEYLAKVIKIHKETQARLKKEISALEKEKRMQEFSRNIRGRITTLLENANSLERQTQ